MHRLREQQTQHTAEATTTLVPTRLSLSAYVCLHVFPFFSLSLSLSPPPLSLELSLSICPSPHVSAFTLPVSPCPSPSPDPHHGLIEVSPEANLLQPGGKKPRPSPTRAPQRNAPRAPAPAATAPHPPFRRKHPPRATTTSAANTGFSHRGRRFRAGVKRHPEVKGLHPRRPVYLDPVHRPVETEGESERL